MGTAPTSGFWLSPQQKRAWDLKQEGRLLRAVVQLDLAQETTAAKLAEVLAEVAGRHECLRTVYVRQSGMKYPFQAVLEKLEPLVRVEDLSGVGLAEQDAAIEELFATAQRTELDESNAPTCSVTLVQRGGGRSSAIVSMSALSADASSLEVVSREIAQRFSGNPSELEEPLRYVQFAQWQNDLINGDDENAPAARKFWDSWLEPLPVPELPLENRGEATYVRQQLYVAVPQELSAKLEAVAKSLQRSKNEILLAAWQSLLWRLSGVGLFRCAATLHLREYEELAASVGLIAKDVPLPARFEGDYRFREVVENVHASLDQATGWQEHYTPGAGFESGQQVGFEYREISSARRVAEWREDYKLRLVATQRQESLNLELQYNEARLSSHVVQQLAGYYLQLLKGALVNPDAPVSQLPVLGHDERRQILEEWNQTAASYPAENCFHELFEAQAAATPDRIAATSSGSALSYRELNEQANQLAHHLKDLGVSANSLVGLCMERSARMMVAVLGILKAGGAYVPLNPDNPKPRNQQQLSGVDVLITQQSLLSQLPTFTGKTVTLDGDAGAWAGQLKSNPTNSTNPDGLVYVIYTSGSTGIPKGVAVRHRNLVNYSCFIARRLRLESFPDALRFATVSTIGADLGNTCIYPALLSGGSVDVIPFEVSTDAQRFAEYAKKSPIDVLKIVPSHLQALLDSPQAAEILPRKFLILGGETFTPGLAGKIESLGGSCEVLNHYGPTETTVGSLTLRLAEYDWQHSSAASIPIGRPIANTQVYILDALRQPVPPGVVGELYIAGEGVTAGYLGQESLTDERFVANPFAANSSARMYRTGDLARFLADGIVEFLGRGDDQVKIRGYRIELGEIEGLLSAQSGVKQVFLQAREDARGDKRLVAYVVQDSGSKTTPEDLRAYLKTQLPDFMVPSAIVPLGKMPLTTNGKVDRQALPDPEAVQPRTYVAPANQTEEGVVSVWESVLHRERIGTDENFFDLGGHSLLATQVISRLRERYQVELPIRAIFDHPTIAGLAGAIENARSTGAAALAPSIGRVARDAYRSGRN